MELRPYTRDDAETTITVFQRAIRATASHDYDPEQVAAWVDEAHRDLDTWHVARAASTTYVATAHDRVVGFVDLTDAGHIDMLFVDPDFTGRGVATALVRWAIATAATSGHARVTTDASLTARPLFASCGFAVASQDEVLLRGITFTRYSMSRSLLPKRTSARQNENDVSTWDDEGVSTDSLLLVTDLTYPARGRRYGDEDIYLSTRLREHFSVAMCHPKDAVALMDNFDVVMVHNSGPVVYYPQDYDQFRQHAVSTGATVYNELSGKADMIGKSYLLDLYRTGFPVIPTIERIGDLHDLGHCDEYVVKPMLGADSVGLRMVTAPDMDTISGDDLLIQPRVDFDYEVSFVFVGHSFVYATYAPDPARRWELQEYGADLADVEFAQKFIEWNDMEHGIQRVDACRTTDGRLLLVELEDLNPYLSLDRISNDKREAFLAHLTADLRSLVASSRPAL